MQAFWLCFVPLFVAVDAFGILPLFITLTEGSWLAFANYLGYLIGALAAAGGWAHGRERLLMLAGLGASTILAALMGLSDTMVAFLVVRFLAGLASAFVMVFRTGCESGSVSQLSVSLSQRGSCESLPANKTFSDDRIPSICGSAGLAPIDKVCRFDVSFN